MYDSTVNILIEMGAVVNHCNKDGESPLCMACVHGQYSTLELLINNGPNIYSRDGKNPLSAARDNGHKDIVMFLNKVGPLSEAYDSTAQLFVENRAEF